MAEPVRQQDHHPGTDRSGAVALDAHAQETLRYIRATMDAAALVPTPGSAGIVIGLVGVVAALLAEGPLRAQGLLVWLAAAPLACLAGVLIMARQQRLLARTVLGASGRRFAVSLAPALLAGAVLTVAELRSGTRQLLPGTWLLLYGAAVLSASAITIRLVAWFGVCFLLAGAVTMLLPVSAHNLMLGLCFGGLHLLFGGFLHLRARDANQA